MGNFKPSEVSLIPTLLKNQLDFLSKSMKNPTVQEEHAMEYAMLKMQQGLHALEGKELEAFLTEAGKCISELRTVLDAAEKELAALLDGGQLIS